MGRRIRRLAVCLGAGSMIGLLVASLGACTEASRPARPPSPESVAADKPAAVVATDEATALRGALTDRLGLDSVLLVDRERSVDAWTFVCGRPSTPSGDPIDYTRTSLAHRAAEGMVDDRACALLQRIPDGVVVRELAVGDTDMGFVEWPARYGISEDILAPG